MSTEKEQILEKITKLISKSESSKEIGSIHEAEIFMNKARQLLIQYNLSESDIKKKDDDYKMVVFNYDEVVNITSNDGIRWVQDLINVICTYNLTKFIHINGTNSCYIVGTQINIDFTKNLVSTMINVFLNLCSKRWSEYNLETKSQKGPIVKRNKFRRDYLDGVVIGVNRNYFLEKKRQEDEEKAKLEGGEVTTLIRMNEVMLQQKISEQFSDLKALKSREKKVSNAVGIGISDGTSYKKDKFIM